MSKKKILLVDDEEDLVYALSMQLEAKGYEVMVARDGQEALDGFRKGKPDLAVLDVMLPKLDGFKICRMIKFDEKFKHIPIIMLSARSQDADVVIGYEVGADDYVTKPFEPKVLLDKIEELLK